MSDLRIGLVVVHWRGMPDTRDCLASITSLSPPAASVVVVVNGSGDFDETAASAACPAAEVLRLDRNLGYAGGCNAGARSLFDRGAEVVLLLNNDVVLEADTLASVASLIDAQPRAGIIGLPVVYEDDQSLVWFAGGHINRWLGYTRHEGFRTHSLPGQAHRTDFVTGAALAIRRDAWDKVRALDERYFHYFEDVDVCDRARAAGFECWIAPRPPVRHKISASAGERGSNRLNRDQAYYFARNRMRWVRETYEAPRRYTALARTSPPPCIRVCESSRGPQRRRGAWSHRRLHRRPTPRERPARRAMRIAIIVPYPIMPPDEGGRVRAYNLVKQLSRSHDVLVLSPSSSAYAEWDLPARVEQTTLPGRARQIIDPGSIAGSSWRATTAFAPDVIVTEYPWPGLRAAIMARRLRRATRVRRAQRRGRSLLAAPAPAFGAALTCYERLLARHAAAVFAVSGEDAARFRARGVAASKIQVVPNGVDPDAMHPDAAAGARIRRELGIADTTKMLLFFGQLGYAPNRDAVAVIHGELLPRLDRSGADYAFVIAGKNDEAAAWTWSHPRLRFTGPVPEIAPYINAADAVAVPVASGGGTRLKVLESIACGTPVVSSTLRR